MNNPQSTAELIKKLAACEGVSVSKLLSDCEMNKNALISLRGITKSYGSGSAAFVHDLQLLLK